MVVEVLFNNPTCFDSGVFIREIFSGGFFNECNGSDDRSVLLFCLKLSVRGKNKKEKLSGFFRNVTQSADEVLLSNQKVSKLF